MCIHFADIQHQEFTMWLCYVFSKKFTSFYNYFQCSYWFFEKFSIILFLNLQRMRANPRTYWVTSKNVMLFLSQPISIYLYPSSLVSGFPNIYCQFIPFISILFSCSVLNSLFYVNRYRLNLLGFSFVFYNKCWYNHKHEFALKYTAYILLHYWFVVCYIKF